MSKKSIFIAVSVLLILFISYRIAKKTIINSIDSANERGLELYASQIKYAYAKEYLNKQGTSEIDLDSLYIKTTIDVVCEEKNVNIKGNIKLMKCSVDGSKTKYNYINGKVEKVK